MKSTASILVLAASALAQQRPETDWTAIFRQHRAPGANEANAAPADSVMLGVTVWRMRPSRPSDDRSVRLLIHESEASKSVELTPERVPTESPLAEDDRVRISIEASQTGYLYVVDQDAYAGGQLGDPLLIFPTSRTRGGDNRVVAGRVIDIPGPRDRPPYFRLKRSRPEQVGELLSLIFTSLPLAEFTGGSEAVRVSKPQLAEWSRKWGGPTERVNFPQGVANPMTAAENGAGSRDLLLEPNDPPPQTIYRFKSTSGTSKLVQVLLRVD